MWDNIELVTTYNYVYNDIRLLVIRKNSTYYQNYTHFSGYNEAITNKNRGKDLDSQSSGLREIQKEL